jgi:hypothetical protein
MVDPGVFSVAALLALLGVGETFWRRLRTRDQVERWLRQHRYRVRELRIPWFGGGFRFGPRLFRSRQRAVVFRAVVDDQSMGGTGVVWLRAWTTWFGLIEEDVEVSWDKMPTPAPAEIGPPEMRWHDKQIALLKRVAAGESTFRADGRSPEDAVEFDELVEYILALNRRGLVTCSTPLANLRGAGQYAAITDVEATLAGLQLLEKERTERERA